MRTSAREKLGKEVLGANPTLRPLGGERHPPNLPLAQVQHLLKLAELACLRWFALYRSLSEGFA
jgi:hypothetical protein